MFDDFRENLENIDNIYNVLNRIVTIGVVTAVDENNALVRVKLTEHHNLVTDWLPVLFRKTQNDKEYWMPDIGEAVIVLFTPPNFERGFVLGSFYTKQDQPPDKSRDKWIIKFKDGSKIEYDRKSHKLSISINGDIEINALGNVLIKGARIDLNP